MRSIWLHQKNDTLDMQKSAYMDRSVPPYINVRSIPTCTNYINKQFVCAQYLRKINDLNLGRRCSTLPTAKHIIRQQKNRLGVRVYVLSDLHTDYPANMAWVQRLSTTTYKRDILIVAGDVAEKFKNFVLTMLFLKERFRHVFFVPGNHDVWCRSKQEPYVDSVEKLGALMEACSDLEVATEPKIIDGVGIIPLFSWYHQSFDKEQDITGLRIPSLKMACKDFHACKWPSTLSSSDLSLAKYFDEMNFKKFEVIREIQETSCQVITFSHFLPRSELCPEKRMLFYPNLPKVIGSDLLEASLRKIHGPNGNPSACHVFGHTHFCWDSVLDGIRYIQAPLAYPRERKRRMNGGEEWLPFCIYDSCSGGIQNESLSCYWSDYYRIQKREPQNTELAPWVAKYYYRTKQQ